MVCDDTGRPSEAVLEAAEAGYKRKHSDWQERDFNVIWVVSEKAKQLTEAIMRGGRYIVRRSIRPGNR